ncbi:MAG: sensor histidine kinase [Clostridium sp.]
MFKSRYDERENEIKKVNIEKIIQNVILGFNKTISENNIEVNLEVEKLCCLGVVSEIRAIIFNLIDNAIKFSTDKRVYINLYAKGDKVVFEVFNKCRRIPKGIINRILEPFYNCDPSTEVGSQGLGLFICRELAQLNNGKIDLEYNGQDIKVILTLDKE